MNCYVQHSIEACLHKTRNLTTSADYDNRFNKNGAKTFQLFYKIEIFLLLEKTYHGNVVYNELGTPEISGDPRITNERAFG